jgi:hypothetical protein
MTKEQARQPWQQQPGESDLRYSRFRAYLDLGPERTLAAAAEALAAAGDRVSLARLRTLSGEGEWVQRARLFDGRPPPPPPQFRLSGDRDPWERQPDESELMYARFRVYLELGRTRTLTQAAEILTSTGDREGLRGVYIRELSARFLWTQRTGAYDREQDRLEREALIEQRRDMIKRHRSIANGLSAKAKSALDKLAVDKLTPLDVVRYFKLAAQIESNALGMPWETVAVTGAGGGALVVDDLAAYTPEERQQRLADLGTEVLRRAAAPVDDMSQEDE